MASLIAATLTLESSTTNTRKRSIGLAPATEDLKHAIINGLCEAIEEILWPPREDTYQSGLSLAAQHESYAPLHGSFHRSKHSYQPLTTTIPLHMRWAKNLQGDDMVINAIEARIEWAARVARQSEEMFIIAAATKDDGMRSELLDFAVRLKEQVANIRAMPAC